MGGGSCRAPPGMGGLAAARSGGTSAPVARWTAAVANQACWTRRSVRSQASRGPSSTGQSTPAESRPRRTEGAMHWAEGARACHPKQGRVFFFFFFFGKKLPGKPKKKKKKKKKKS